MSSNTYNICWDKLLWDIAILGDKIEEEGLHKHQFVGLIRGGSILASILSHRFKQMPIMLDTSSLHNKHENRIQASSHLVQITPSHKQILFVDNVLHTGNTMKNIVHLSNSSFPTIDVKSATIYVMHKHMNYAPSIFVEYILTDSIYFPYEI